MIIVRFCAPAVAHADTVIGARMTQSTNHAPDLMRILSKAGPYPIAAYQFVQEGLRATVERLHDQHARALAESEGGMGAMASNDRHITGQQLCMGLRDHAIEQYGLLARAVLSHWHIHRTDDFGRIVFALIDAGLMSKTPQDTIDDFRGVYEFDEAFHPEQMAGALRCARA